MPARGLGTYKGKGNDTVITPDWHPTGRRIVINATQFFADVPLEVWGFTIGGYQVLRQYLKARKGRALTISEIENVEQVVVVLAFTIDCMTDIEVEYKAAFRST